VFFREEKTQIPAPAISFGRRFSSALESAWNGIDSLRRSPSPSNKSSLSQDFRKQECAPELFGLVDTLAGFRQKILANEFMRGWAVWTSWILVGLIVVFMISAKLAISILLAIALVVGGAGAILLWTWRTRISTYQTACRLDAAAGLQDRVSTAIYLGNEKHPSGMVERQREDALARFAEEDLSSLFPLRMPVAARRVLILLLAMGALYFYRLHHKPPLTSLLQSVARSQLVQSIVSPLVTALEKDVQRTMALVSGKPDAVSEEVRANESAAANDDLWQSNKDANAKDDQQDSLDAGTGDASKDQQQTPGDQNGSPSEQSRPQESNSQQSQNGKNPGDSSQGDSAKPSDSQGSSPQESLGQSLMQALKNMMSDSSKQQSGNRENQKPQQQNSQGAPQSGNSHQPGSNESDKKGESRGNSDAEQKPTNSASNGAGSQEGLKELKKSQDTHSAARAVPDRVALEASGFKDQTRMRVDTETGTAQLATGDSSSQSAATINGAEQENIPPRYRLYVQRYFEHANNGTR